MYPLPSINVFLTRSRGYYCHSMDNLWIKESEWGKIIKDKYLKYIFMQDGIANPMICTGNSYQKRMVYNNETLTENKSRKQYVLFFKVYPCKPHFVIYKRDKSVSCNNLIFV